MVLMVTEQEVWSFIPEKGAVCWWAMRFVYSEAVIWVDLPEKQKKL